MEKQVTIYDLLNQTVFRLHKLLKRELEKFDLSLNEFETLEHLYLYGEKPIQQIGRDIFHTTSSLTYLVDKLVGKKLVERIASRNDRRKMYVGLTEKGVELMDEILPRYHARLDNILGDSTNEDTKHAMRFLEEIQNNIEL